ncbi:hypothetical protein ACFFTM_20080 [Pseudoduganella plicata]|uniref:DUF115 domain-containing protein n=1 Tax=Pseudoduganella plicata TaxID=321984 RepID=A0A4V1ATX3_9BURK|nr:hypothetical protein [Pseudoduganella plicata]QBQ37168.1 hypothetical protein E1742_14030 [Pseudoduganella plicata]GGY98807.1 hypothetical protein GCM10007388_35510 [Pseudoduganella plicata]
MLAEARLQPVHDALLYLRSYVDDSAAAFGRFLDARILLVAGDYALIGAIKTLACLGVRRLSVLQLGDEWQAHELRDAFGELARWPDAALDIVTAATPDHTLVLQCGADAACPFEALVAALPDARHLAAFVSNGQLCVLHGADVALLPTRPSGAPVSPCDSLCAGATAAAICFDDLCGVRALAPRRYLHFGLDADVPMGSAGLYPLLPFAAGWAGVEDAIAVGARVAELVRTPLSPLCSPVERTQEGCYIKLYTLQAQLPGRSAPVTLVGAGMTHAECMAGALLQLVDAQRHWFCNTAPAERAAIGAYLARLDIAEQAIAPLRAAPPPQGTAPALTAREQYLSFCINTAYGRRVQWADTELATSAWARCTVMSAGDVAIYLPHEGQPEPGQREAGLLALYGALWSADGGVRDVILADHPLQVPAPEAA